MKRILLLAVALAFVSACAFGQINNGGGGGSSTTVVVPQQVVQSGLLAEYRMLATESPAALVDYSGNSNNATGTVGTAPTIIATTGGVNFTGNGAVSLPSALNNALTVQFFISYQNANDANTFEGLVVGSSTPANSAAVMLSRGTTNGCLAIAGGVHPVTYHAGSGPGFNLESRNTWNGTGVITMTIGPVNDDIFINGVRSNFGIGDAVTGCGSYGGTIKNAMLAGNFQLGGAAAGTGVALQSYYTGQIYYAVFYNRVLNSAEIAQNSQVIANILSARGVASTLNATDQSDQVVADGDSITNAQPGALNPYTASWVPNGTWQVTNIGSTAITCQGLGITDPYSTDPLYRPGANRNAVIEWCGTNDVTNGKTAAQAIAFLRQICQARRAVGFKCIPVTMISRTGQDTNKNSYNALIRQYWPTFADALADVAADPNLGADGASANTTFFQVDAVHPTQHGVYNDEQPILQRTLNRFYGNRDFSFATNYSSAASGTVATTAGSESTNTITITFGATPANCQQGNTITIAGTTPAGYSGNWTILTRSSTQVTYWSNTTGLGAITVQGTGVCPQQQDADWYTVLNFGAGNFTLESCQGWTGQNIYLKNINGSSSTIVPFGSETIDGASTLTIATKATVVLQSILVSASAAGCNWKQLQNN